MPEVPVLLSAIGVMPDWILIRSAWNSTPMVARGVGLRIVAPVEFFSDLSVLFHWWGIGCPAG